MQAQEAETFTLEQVIEAALQNNNLLHIKQLQVSEQDTKIKESKVKYFPIVSLNSTYQYNFNIGTLTVPEGSFGSLPLYYPTGMVNVAMPNEDAVFDLGKHNAFNAGVTAYQPLTRLFKVNTGVHVAKTDRSIAVLEQTKAELQITNAVEQLYYGILAVNKRKVELQKNIEIAALKLYDVQSAVLSGKTIDANEAGLRANVADKQQELLKLNFQEEDYIVELKKITGISSNEILLADEETVLPTNKDLQSYQEDAETNSVDIQLIQLQKQKAELGIKAAQNSYLPELGIIGGYTYQYGNNIFPEHNPFVGLSLRWNITDLFGNKQDYSRNNIVKKQAKEKEIYTKKEISAKVETAYRKMKQSQELISVAEKTVEYRKQELKVEQDRKDAGLATQIKVLETEAALAKSEADLYGAKQSYKVALSELNMLTQNGK